MASPAENPFTALTIVVAPAILTNASSLLCFGTANRLARVMDRTRAVSAQLAGEGLNEGNRAMYEHQLRELEVRHRKPAAASNDAIRARRSPCAACVHWRQVPGNA